MTGRVLSFDNNTGTGIISGDNGARYTFSQEAWKDTTAPQAGVYVDFAPAPGDKAADIYTAAQPAVAHARTSGLAIASLVTSILLFWFYGIGSILGIIFGHIARAEIKKSNGTLTGDGLALAGMIIGYIGIGLLVMFIFVIMAAAMSNTY